MQAVHSLRLSVIFLCLLAMESLASEKAPSRQDLQKIQTNIEKQLRKLDKKNSERDKLNKGLRAVENRQATIATRIKKLNSDILKLKRTLLEKQSQQASFQEQLQTQTEQIQAILFSTYRLGRESRIKLFLNLENVNKLSRTLTFANYIGEAHRKEIEAFKKTLKELETIKMAIEQDQRNLANQQQSLVKEQATLDQTAEERKALIARINREINHQEKHIQSLKADQKRLVALFDAMQASLTADPKLNAGKHPFSKTKRLLPPPAKGRLVKRFGKRVDNTPLTWQGISFLGETGEAVEAVHYGRVVFSGWFRGKGLLLIIDHGEGYMTLYAHNQTLLFETGDWVQKHDIIATIGNSGGLDHSELYFEIRHHGEALNPLHWLRSK